MRLLNRQGGSARIVVKSVAPAVASRLSAVDFAGSYLCMSVVAPLPTVYTTIYHASKKKIDMI